MKDNARGTSKSGSPSILLALARIGVGAWNLLGARSVWWLSYGWWYEKAEPSQAVKDPILRSINLFLTDSKG